MLVFLLNMQCHVFWKGWFVYFNIRYHAHFMSFLVHLVGHSKESLTDKIWYYMCIYFSLLPNLSRQWPSHRVIGPVLLSSSWQTMARQVSWADPIHLTPFTDPIHHSADPIQRSANGMPRRTPEHARLCNVHQCHSNTALVLADARCTILIYRLQFAWYGHASHAQSKYNNYFAL